MFLLELLNDLPTEFLRDPQVRPRGDLKERTGVDKNESQRRSAKLFGQRRGAEGRFHATGIGSAGKL